jgi:hypothetical protein
MNTRKLIAVLTLTLVVGLSSFAGAADLWDQTAGYESWSAGFFNNIAGSPPFGSTMYTANDIVVPAGGWVIETMKIYYDGFNPGWAGAVTSAVLYVEPKTGPAPTGDPSTGTTVTVATTVLGNGFLEVAANGLDLVLDEGEYWISLTPSTPNADNIFVSVANVGDASPTYDAFGFPMPMWGAWVPDFDGAILIQGYDGTVDTEEMSWDQTKAMYR